MGKPIEPGCTVVVTGGYKPEFLGRTGTVEDWVPEGAPVFREGETLPIVFSLGEWLCNFDGTMIMALPQFLRRIDDYDPNADELEQEELDNETV